MCYLSCAEYIKHITYFLQQAIENTFAVANKIEKGDCFCELPPGIDGERMHLISDISGYNETICSVRRIIN